MEKSIHAQGKRKRAVARATLKAGKGRVTVNGESLESYRPELYQLKIKEPLILSGEVANQVDIKINVRGGGFSSQTDAIRLAVGKVLSQHSTKLKKVFLDYDRTLLVADVRRKEASKPNRHGQARAKRQKSYR